MFYPVTNEKLRLLVQDSRVSVKIIAVRLMKNVEEKLMESDASWLEHSVCTELASQDLALGTTSRW